MPIETDDFWSTVFKEAVAIMEAAKPFRIDGQTAFDLALDKVREQRGELKLTA